MSDFKVTYIDMVPYFEDYDKLHSFILVNKDSNVHIDAKYDSDDVIYFLNSHL